MKISYLLVEENGSRTIQEDKEVLLTTKAGNFIIDIDGKEGIVLKERVLSEELLKEFFDVQKKNMQYLEAASDLSRKIEDLRDKIFHQGEVC